MRKFFLLSFASLIAAILITPFITRAADTATYKTATDAVVIANVNIYEAKIISQNGNKLTVAFDINNRSGIQPGVRYGIELKQAGNSKQPEKIISHVFNETLLLKDGETIHKEVVYDVPEYADGSYEVWVISKNDKSMPLGLGMAGKATFKASGSYINIIDGSCSLKVQGEESGKKYQPSEGVDIDKDETLEATCVLQNTSVKTIQATLKMETYFRTTYGDQISADYGSSVTVNPKEVKIIQFLLPNAQKPQAYDVAVTLVNGEKEDVSNVAVLHYVLRGKSGTIQNLRLDKEAYQKGETAKVSFYWTGSADSFRNARKPASQLGQVKIAVQISGEDNKLCAPVLEKETNVSESQTIELQTTIQSNCQSPKVSATIKDASGTLLDQTSFSLESGAKKDNPIVSANVPSERNTIWVILGIIVSVPLILLVGFMVAKKIKKIPPVAFFLIAGVLLCLGGGVEAETINIGDAQYVVNYNKAEYSTGEWVVAYGTATRESVCGNGNNTYSQLNGYFPTTNPPIGSAAIPVRFVDHTCSPDQPYVCYGDPWNFCMGGPGSCIGSTSGSMGGIVNQPGTHYGYFSGVSWSAGWSAWHPMPYIVKGCGDGLPDAGEQCDLGSANNGTCPKTCSSSCTRNICAPPCATVPQSTPTSSVAPLETPKGTTFQVKCDYGSTAIDSIGVQTDADADTCIWAGWNDTAAIFNCSADIIGTHDVSCFVKNVYPGTNYCALPATLAGTINVTDPEACNPVCTSGRTCCRTAGQPGACRVNCSSCTNDASCGSNECCNKENSVCSTNQEYCGNLDYTLTADNDISIYLTGNEGYNAGSTRIRVVPSGGFSKEVALSQVSSLPDNRLITEGEIALSVSSLASSDYGRGSNLTVRVLNNIIPAGTSKTYQLTIKGVANAIEKTKIIKVKIYGQAWAQP